MLCWREEHLSFQRQQMRSQELCVLEPGSAGDADRALTPCSDRSSSLGVPPTALYQSREAVASSRAHGSSPVGRDKHQREAVWAGAGVGEVPAASPEQGMCRCLRCLRCLLLQ